jgi:hypothetical protein
MCPSQSTLRVIFHLAKLSGLGFWLLHALLRRVVSTTLPNPITLFARQIVKTIDRLEADLAINTT